MATRRPLGLNRLASVPLSLLFASAALADTLNTDFVSSGQSSERASSAPREHRLEAAEPFLGDLRSLPQTRPERFERPELPEPEPHPTVYPGTQPQLTPSTPAQLGPSAPAPSPFTSFDGLDFATWGAGHPPDSNGDVGPTYYIQTVNTSIGIYRKSDGALVAAFTFNTFMSQGKFDNLCDTNNFGDPVVLYDTFEDRWVITDFAFKLDGSNNVINPPGSFQCFAVSKSGDPVSGGWNFFSVPTAGGLGDYPKFGIWTDGLYMSANMYGYASGGAFQGARVYALNKAQMYAGASTVQVVSFEAPSAEFSLLPANARLQSGTPPAGTPNFFLATWQFLNALTVYKFHVDWNRITLSTFTGPDIPAAATSWPNSGPANAPSLGGNALDVLQIRAMMQNRYTNMGGLESLWATHTVRRGNTSGFAAPRWYQVNVTGGTVAANLPQAATWDPDGANVLYRFMPSLAVDRAGNMALGYSTSSSTTKPAIMYAGRLATDPANTFSQTEQVLIQGGGTQTGSCGGTCARWGDYSAMTLDPDGCTFWYTNEYYAVDGLNDLTRIGAFSFPSCTPVGIGGTVQGSVTSADSAPIAGATVAFGSRIAITDSSGFYSFVGIPAGIYPGVTANAPGFISGTVSSAAVSDGGTTTQDFSLVTAPSSGCLVDTTQADFLLGVPTGCNLNGSPDDVILSRLSLDQQNATIGTSGVGITITTWGGQTFTPAVTGALTKVDINLFCSGCTGTTPNLTLSVRATSSNLPTGADLASTTIPGFGNGGVANYLTATFGTPATLTAGTKYALVIRPTANPAPGTYALTRSGTSTLGSDVYAGGTRVSGATSGTVWSIPTTGGISTDTGFRTYVDSGFLSSGKFVSSLKDANPAPGFAAAWTTVSWTASAPTGTGVTFQVAGRNDLNGPFNFVGPDGTASTFFTSGELLTQFNGQRYLKYQVLLSTSDGSVTPAIDKVTVCFNNLPIVNTALAVDPATGAYGGTVNLSATLSAGGSPLSGKSVSFVLNKTDAGSGTTDSNGVASVTGISLVGLGPGSYPGGIMAQFTGDFASSPSDGSATLTVTKLDQLISFAVIADKLATDAPFSITATGGDSGNPVTFSTDSKACGVSGETITVLSAGGCAIQADQAGDKIYNAAGPVTRTFNISLAPQTIAFQPIASFVWSGGSATLDATASSGLAVSFGVVSGSCHVLGSAVTATGAGNCVIAADQPGDNHYSAAPRVTGGVTVNTASQTIVFAKLADKLATDAPFDVTATGGASGNPVTFSTTSSACSVTGITVSIFSAGTCDISADQAGNADYGAAARVTQSFDVAIVPQTIKFEAILPFPWGSGFAKLDATASSGLAVIFSVVSGPCHVLDSMLTATATGTCVVAADQAGDGQYSAAPQVSQSVDVTKASQSIAFAALADKLATDDPFALTATGGGSGNPVTFSTTSSACSVSGSTVTLLTAGGCSINAGQAGNVDYSAATTVMRSFNISLHAQTITFPGIVSFTWSSGSSTLAATASSGLAVSYSVITGPCLITGTTLTATSAGSCVIAADQAGNSRYGVATQVTAAVNLSKAPQAISFGALADQLATDAAFAVSATGGGSGNPVTFSTASNACSVSGNVVTINFAGPCAINADQAGNGNYTASARVTQSFNITLSPQTINFPQIASFIWGSGSATLSATAGSGLSIIYSVVSGPCSVLGSTLTASAAGSCTVAADQAGNNRFSAAPRVTVGVTTLKAAQAISFGALADKIATDAPFSLTATGGGSGKAVTFSTASAACSVSGNTVTILGAGLCQISADQAADANYTAATQVTQTFTIAQAPQAITFPAIDSFIWKGGSATLSAVASSGLAVTYSVLSGSCVVSGNTLTATAAGTCVIAADQPGNSRYGAAQRATASVAVTDVPVLHMGGCGGCGSTPGSTGAAFEILVTFVAGASLRRRMRRGRLQR